MQAVRRCSRQEVVLSRLSIKTRWPIWSLAKSRNGRFPLFVREKVAKTNVARKKIWSSKRDEPKPTIFCLHADTKVEGFSKSFSKSQILSHLQICSRVDKRSKCIKKSYICLKKKYYPRVCGQNKNEELTAEEYFIQKSALGTLCEAKYLVNFDPFHSAACWHHGLLLLNLIVTRVLQNPLWTKSSQIKHGTARQIPKHWTCCKYPLSAYLPSKVSKLIERDTLPLWESILYYPTAGITYK